MAQLQTLPKDILVLLPDYLHNIEDYTNLSSTCRGLRECMQTANPNTILRLAATQTKIFFRPSPHFLVAATARELGHWARKSDENEDEFALKCQDGIHGVMELALEHCGLTMERVRELHRLRFDIINPVTNIIDQCVGAQWHDVENFWDGGREDAYTVDADPPETFFHLAIYGELFAPDIETVLDQDSNTRKLNVQTRLEFVKYCIPDFAVYVGANLDAPDGNNQVDPARGVHMTGPYAIAEDGRPPFMNNNNIALVWVQKSIRWKPHWQAVRVKAGPDFQEDFDDVWWTHWGLDQNDWRQRMWENVMLCQGLEGLGMIMPQFHDHWVSTIKEWRERIAALEREPEITTVGVQTTMEYPFLLGDLRICCSGYVPGT